MISKGNHVTSRDSCCLPSVKKQKHDFQVFAFVQCIIKQLLDSVCVLSRIIKVSVRVISLSLRLRLITLTSTLIILDNTKTSSNNCLIISEGYHFKHGCSLVVGLSIGWVQLNRLKHNHHTCSVWVQEENSNV